MEARRPHEYPGARVNNSLFIEYKCETDIYIYICMYEVIDIHWVGKKCRKGNTITSIGQ